MIFSAGQDHNVSSAIEVKVEIEAIDEAPASESAAPAALTMNVPTPKADGAFVEENDNCEVCTVLVYCPFLFIVHYVLYLWQRLSALLKGLLTYSTVSNLLTEVTVEQLIYINCLPQ